MKKYAMYGTFIDGLDLSKRSVILFNLIFIVRRLVMCYVAVFLDEYPWLQIIIFVVTSQLNLLYLAYAAPFDSYQRHFTEQLNE